MSSSPYAPPLAGAREFATDREAGLWYIDQSALYPDVYNAPFVLELSARLDHGVLRSALATVIARHRRARRHGATVPLETWLSHLAGREDERGLALAAITELLRDAALETHLATLATDATAQALRDLDVAVPRFDDSWLTAMTRYFSETGYFRPPLAFRLSQQAYSKERMVR